MNERQKVARDPKADAEKAKLTEEGDLKFKGEESFVDDYERPVLEKYEKVSPTPLTKPKKEKGETKVSFYESSNIKIKVFIIITCYNSSFFETKKTNKHNHTQHKHKASELIDNPKKLEIVENVSNKNQKATIEMFSDVPNKVHLYSMS